MRNPLAGLLGALIALVAGFGILRKRVWAAYGYGLLQFAGGLSALTLLREKGDGNIVQAVATGLVGLLFAAFFFLAGRSLKRTGGKLGGAIPWIVAVSLLNIPLFFVRAYVQSTGSMENTLLTGERILGRVYPPMTPVRGDIVLFHQRLEHGDASILIKRVVGVPGDRIHMTSRILYVNGSALTEPYVVHRDRQGNHGRDNFPLDQAEMEELRFVIGSAEMADARQDMTLNHVERGEVVVPVGKFFVLGDNRDNSLDSRFFGFVDKGDLIGKPLLIYDSQEPPAVSGAFSWPKIRWSRLLRWL